VEGLSTLDWNGTAAINLTGNALANYIIGNDGANVLNGGAGSDLLFGRGGADMFVFADPLGANNVDLLGDFNAADDTIRLDHNVFTGLGIGDLNPGAFVTGTQAGDADDRIIYNQATGQLLFDADGAGGNAAVLFATLSGNPVLTASDFVVL
jgi:serralysin